MVPAEPWAWSCQSNVDCHQNHGPTHLGLWLNQLNCRGPVSLPRLSTLAGGLGGGERTKKGPLEDHDHGKRGEGASRLTCPRPRLQASRTFWRRRRWTGATLPCVSTAFAAKTLPCVSTAFAAKTLPCVSTAFAAKALPCVPTAFAAKTLPCVLHCIRG